MLKFVFINSELFMRTLILLLSFFISLTVFSQKGDVSITKDERIDYLIKQRGLIVPPATSPQITGYRIQLIFDSNKKLIDDSRSKIVSIYPKIDTYINYNAPHFVLKVGDFRTKQDAERIRDSLLRDFPTSFVIKETINLPRID
jgi:hypothetical protein